MAPLVVARHNRGTNMLSKGKKPSWYTRAKNATVKAARSAKVSILSLLPKLAPKQHKRPRSKTPNEIITQLCAYRTRKRKSKHYTSYRMVPHSDTIARRRCEKTLGEDAHEFDNAIMRVSTVFHYRPHILLSIIRTLAKQYHLGPLESISRSQYPHLVAAIRLITMELSEGAIEFEERYDVDLGTVPPWLLTVWVVLEAEMKAHPQSGTPTSLGAILIRGATWSSLRMELPLAREAVEHMNSPLDYTSSVYNIRALSWRKDTPFTIRLCRHNRRIPLRIKTPRVGIIPIVVVPLEDIPTTTDPLEDVPTITDPIEDRPMRGVDPPEKMDVEVRSEIGSVDEQDALLEMQEEEVPADGVEITVTTRIETREAAYLWRQTEDEEMEAQIEVTVTTRIGTHMPAEDDGQESRRVGQWLGLLRGESSQYMRCLNPHGLTNI
jgi:hypothetical protein